MIETTALQVLHRGVPYHAESTLSSAQVLQVNKAQGGEDESAGTPSPHLSHRSWSTWSAVSNSTPRARELRSAPSGPDDWVAGKRALALGGARSQGHNTGSLRVSSAQSLANSRSVLHPEIFPLSFCPLSCSVVLCASIPLPGLCPSLCVALGGVFLPFCSSTKSHLRLSRDRENNRRPNGRTSHTWHPVARIHRYRASSCRQRSKSSCNARATSWGKLTQPAFAPSLTSARPPKRFIPKPSSVSPTR